MSDTKATGQSRDRSGQQIQNAPTSKPAYQIPGEVLQQADAAAASAAAAQETRQPALDTAPPIEDVPPPPYSAHQYGEVDVNHNGFDTGAKVARDGRVDIKICSNNLRFSSILRRQIDMNRSAPAPDPDIPEGLGYASGLPPPPMNIVIQIVGSRGDVQPFVALGLVLKNKFNHRVRIATHPVFRDFVTENGLEFFSIGGDPAELMAFMVKNPGLMPGIEALRSGDIGKRRKGIYEMITGCWRSCIEPGDGTGPPASDDLLDDRMADGSFAPNDATARPFVADAIIANPPSFAHIHIAERLGIPLHLMFTMPWSPTQAFPHPLANIVSSNTDAGLTNFMSYILVDLLTWQGIGDVINRFREKQLNLDPLSVIWAPGNLHRLRVPWTYCWSPALIPKPGDWSNNIDLSGFYFLNLATNYTPDADLASFLAAGPPPVYIGFGSIVVDDPNAMTKLIFEAVKKTGQRALVSKGWGGLSGDEMGVPEGVFMLGNVPHDWLFKKVSCVVHHGGAGTTAAGITAGRPTVIVPFFGDQQFWGKMCHRAGAGPEPIPNKELTAEKLADAINFCLQPEVLDRANDMSNKIKQETGTETGAESFHHHLGVSKLRCSICPGRVAVWQYKKTDVRLSSLAATVLANSGLVDFADLKLYRAREFVVETGPPEPISGGAAALMGSIGSVTAGIADYPSEILKSFRKNSSKRQNSDRESAKNSAASATESPRELSSDPGQQSMADSSDVTSMSQFSTEPSELSTAATDVGLDTVPAKLDAIALSDRETQIPTIMTSSPSPGSEDQSRHSRWSRSVSQQGSRSATPKSHNKQQSIDRAQQITVDSVIGSAKATGNIIAAGMKSPVDFTLSLAQGFHNAPKLYGDKTVRQPDKITDFQSGLKAAGKEFGYGFYDGITGVVTQPIQGAREEGITGFGKGLIRGSFGLILKPGAAIWGLPGYTMKGVYQEIVKNFGKSTTNYIIAARTAQGYEEWRSSAEGERERIVATWKSNEIQSQLARKKARKSSLNVPVASAASPSVAGSDATDTERGDSKYYDKDGNLLSGFMATRHLNWDERKELSRLKKQEKQFLKSSSQQLPMQVPTPSTPATGPVPEASDVEFEQAIRNAIQQTSNNNPEEDARIERALRASVRELQRAKTRDLEGTEENAHDGDDAYSRAVAASIAEYQRHQSPLEGQESGTVAASTQDEDEDEELRRAITRSLTETRQTHDPPSENSNVHGDVDTDEDEDYRRAIEESKRSHTTRASTVPYHAAAPASEAMSPPSLPPRLSAIHHDEDEEADLQRALEASEQEAKQHELNLNKQKTEEDIVLEYIKKQSLQEEEHRQKLLGQQQHSQQ